MGIVGLGGKGDLMMGQINNPVFNGHKPQQRAFAKPPLPWGHSMKVRRRKCPKVEQGKRIIACCGRSSKKSSCAIKKRNSGSDACASRNKKRQRWRRQMRHQQQWAPGSKWGRL